ncbi:MAG: hypothetical protein H6662_04695 [Ardenticatenaceae bacterium]|nr:hypothetical protein [Ardenticatenaceae bacterium]MCB8991624.1 hypothetical protein [Ardenticatenaceae bacterium]
MSDTQTTTDTPIPPELVQQVADKVYKLWRKDLQIENERRRTHIQKRPGRRTK